MFNTRTESDVSWFMSEVAPPSVATPSSDGNFFIPFFTALVTAVMDDMQDNNPLLLNALRAKWPDAVERELLSIRSELAE